MGELAEACRLGEETHTLYREAFGGEHPASLACAVDVGAGRGHRHRLRVEQIG